MKQQGINSWCYYNCFFLIGPYQLWLLITSPRQQSQAVSPHRAKVCGKLRSFLLSLGRRKKKKKGVLFSNSPVRGATELGLHNHTTENRKIQIKARAHAREICNKTLCQRITGEKKSNEAERTCWTTFLLTQGGRKKQNLPVLRSLKKCPRYTGAFL